MLKSRHTARICVCILLFCSSLLLLTWAPSAQGQGSPDFTLSAQPPGPSSVFPGVSSLSFVQVGTINGFNSSVALTCTVSPQVTNGATCTPSPASVTPPAAPTLTINTTDLTPAGPYQITLTGVGGGITNQIPVGSVTVEGTTPAYTITVTKLVSPASVHAGSGATAQVTLTPAFGYTGNVTLACSTITPAVTLPPQCSFNPATVPVTGSANETSTLTITTFGPAVAAVAGPRIFYAAWLPLSGLALIAVGMGARGTRRKRLLSLLVLCGIAGGLLFMPACGSNYNNSTSTSSNGNTPNNSYTITLTGADASGTIPSNTSQTVSLTVN